MTTEADSLISFYVSLQLVFYALGDVGQGPLDLGGIC